MFFSFITVVSNTTRARSRLLSAARGATAAHYENARHVSVRSCIGMGWEAAIDHLIRSLS